MDPLQKKGLMLDETRKDLLENEVVLITPLGSGIPRDFTGLTDKKIRLIAVGDPASVPAGKYGR